MVRHFRVNWKVQKRGGELGLEPQFHPPLGLPSPLTSCKEKQTNKQKRRDQSVCRCLFFFTNKQTNKQLTYHDFVVVRLMQSLSYMLWMRKCSITFDLESESGI